MDSKPSNTVYAKVKSRSELAAEYGISTRTLNRWLKNAGIILPRGLIRPAELLSVYDKFGYPGELIKKQ